MWLHLVGCCGQDIVLTELTQDALKTRRTMSVHRRNLYMMRFNLLKACKQFGNPLAAVMTNECSIISDKCSIGPHIRSVSRVSLDIASVRLQEIIAQIEDATWL